MQGPTRSLISAFNSYSPSGKYRKFRKFSRGFNFCVKRHCTRNILKLEMYPWDTDAPAYVKFAYPHKQNKDILYEQTLAGMLDGQR